MLNILPVAIATALQEIPGIYSKHLFNNKSLLAAVKNYDTR